MGLKTIRVKEETFNKFRKLGNRTQTDDDIVGLLLSLADISFLDGSGHNSKNFEKVRYIEEGLMGNM